MANNFSQGEYINSDDRLVVLGPYGPMHVFLPGPI